MTLNKKLKSRLDKKIQVCYLLYTLTIVKGAKFFCIIKQENQIQILL